VALLNYTTRIDANRTVSQIQKLLTDNGARAILVEYDEHGNPTALTFRIAAAGGDESYRLPANLDGIFRTLTRQNQRGLVPARFVTREQARRVGWRIVKDWVEAQVAILVSGMVTLDELLLPWMVGPTGQTVYDVYRARQLQLPAAGQSSAPLSIIDAPP
jgi:hypothetical protein